MLVSKQHNDPRRSLILAGGGMRVAYQAGVLMALEESGIKFSHVDGTSGGIFNAAMLASGLEPREIAMRWRTLPVKNFISSRKFKDYLKPFSMTGFADADNIRKKIFPHLGIDIHKIRNNATINATFNVCNFSDKYVEAIAHDEVLEDHLIAGVSLPLMMPALKIGKDWYTDAVWIKDANLLEAVRQQSEELWLVWAIGNTHNYFPGAFNQYVHMIEMSANGALLEEYKQINLINQLISKGTGNPYPEKRIRLFVIKSPYPLPLDPDLFFNKISTRELINMGYDHTKCYLAQQPLPEISMNKEATKNMDPGTVLSFRAIFNGRLPSGNTYSEITYYTYFRFIWQNDKPWLCFSSSITTLDQETISYGHQIKCTKNKDSTLLNISSRLLIQGKEQYLSATFTLHTPIDFFLGLALKRCFITIGDNAATPLIQGYLHQSITNRLKACYATSVYTDQGKSGGIKTRFLMVSKLLEYEV